MATQSYNLDIHSYSLPEILGLFDLTYNISVEDLKRAKKKVLMTHPDKSKLPSEYFLFYKTAYQIILTFYNNEHKHEQHEQPNQNQTNQNQKTSYNSSAYDGEETISQNVKSAIKDMTPKMFQSKFNALFEENAQVKPKAKNEWLSDDKPIYNNISETITPSNMGSNFDKMKNAQQSQHMVAYKGIQPLTSKSAFANKLYDDDDDDDNEYICSDPFSKLKFEDLRKVHKDQTIFAVGEQDFANVKKYDSVEQYASQRVSHKPLEKQESENLLSTQFEQYKQSIMKKQYNEELKIKQNEEKKKQILAGFMLLK